MKSTLISFPVSHRKENYIVLVFNSQKKKIESKIPFKSGRGEKKSTNMFFKRQSLHPTSFDFINRINQNKEELLLSIRMTTKYVRRVCPWFDSWTPSKIDSVHLLILMAIYVWPIKMTLLSCHFSLSCRKILCNFCYLSHFLHVVVDRWPFHSTHMNNRQFFIVLASFVASLTMALGCLYAAMQMHITILHGVLRWPMSTFDMTPMGRILNRFSKEIDVVDITLPMNLRSWITQFFAVIKDKSYQWIMLGNFGSVHRGDYLRKSHFHRFFVKCQVENGYFKSSKNRWRDSLCKQSKGSIQIHKKNVRRMKLISFSFLCWFSLFEGEFISFLLLYFYIISTC